MPREALDPNRDSDKESRIRGIPALLLCSLGFHDYGLVDTSMTFGASNSVTHYTCRRCGKAETKAE